MKKLITTNASLANLSILLIIASIFSFGIYTVVSIVGINLTPKFNLLIIVNMLIAIIATVFLAISKRYTLLRDNLAMLLFLILEFITFFSFVIYTIGSLTYKAS